MTKSRIAEWILSQILPPDRAASTVGDWMEDSPNRGHVWFWYCVIRTAVSRVWTDLTESPFTMARWGLTGFAMNMLVPLGLYGLTIIFRSLGPGRGIDMRYRHDWVYTYFLTYKNHALPPHFELTLPVQLSFIMLWISVRFRTGRRIALRLPGREVAGCIAMSLVGWAFVVALEMLGSTYIRLSPSVLPIGAADDMVLLGGALWLRHRQLHPVG